MISPTLSCVFDIYTYIICIFCLQCFDTVGWAAGRASGPQKIWGDGGGWHWLVRLEWRPAGWSMCLLLLISSCTIKSRSSLLAPDREERAVKWLWSWYLVYFEIYKIHSTILWPFFQNYLREPVLEEEIFWTLWCKVG